MSVAPPAALSSTTLWATASKEWVIPPKPKPGRKPKKDASSSSSTATTAAAQITTDDGRRVQNRAAQRAFRERKQSQLAELQARILQYEQGEIERNVALQQVAKRLKEENDQLREENLSLRGKLLQVERERDSSKRPHEEFFSDEGYSDARLRKKSRIVGDDFAHASTASVAASIPFFPSPPSLVSSPGSNLSDHSFSPVPEPSQQASIFTPQISLGGVFDFQSTPTTSSRPPVYESAAPAETFDCGFCSDNNPCVCRELALHTQQQQQPPPLRIDTFKVEVEDKLRPTPLTTPVGIVRPNILDNLPAYQPAVPLRRRTANTPAKPLFPVIPPGTDCSSGRTVPGAACSGDPSNCPACADDAFGKAFCTAVGEAVNSQGRCADCPDRPSMSDGGAAGPSLCCGMPDLCGGNCKSIRGRENTETIPTSEAWRRIKSHPNVSFTDLSLLADVVARRSKCTGPTVVIEPAPGAFTPERCESPGVAPPRPSALTAEQDAVLLSDPHAHYKQLQRERSAVSSSPPPRLVPHDELVECARRRVRMVHADGVREALRFLDAKFGQA
ncbi:hypothetical protein K488DRAFT_45751 [Vararia minispora EC-137]|uniref:Uncharacterized protein n=1 Tax=Vararia minispora EC-137 TaxID=1314806 RepID=A0ACB8QRP5_9AGAM|nr:hypothetical protein K488DRAFT_45751 [Vararia minispora EC-137]